MEFQVGQRVIRKSNGEYAFIHAKSKRRTVMLEVKWEATGIKQWLPGEEFQPWDKAETPPEVKLGWKGRTTPDYIMQMRFSKQLHDERQKRYKHNAKKRDMEQMTESLLGFSRAKSKSKMRQKKMLAKLQERIARDKD